MFRLLGALVLQAASAASILGLYFSLIPPAQTRPSWHWGIIGFVVFTAILLFLMEGFLYFSRRPKLFSDQLRINKYMRRLIGSGRRAVIFSRDMSWANEPETRELLFRKAREGDLMIFIEHNMQIINELKESGARILRYGKFNHLPKSRFTIIDFGQEGARVAIGVVRPGNKHEIREYYDGEHPLFAMAEDFVKILENACEEA